MPRAKRKAKAASAAPVCRLCGRSGAGVTFAIFNPKVPPFGTCCTDCESTLPPGEVNLGALLTTKAPKCAPCDGTGFKSTVAISPGFTVSAVCDACFGYCHSAVPA